MADPLPGAALHDLLAEARALGPLVETRLLGSPALLITRYAELKAFFADHLTFPGGPVYQFQVEPVLGRTMISLDGAEHDRCRRLATPAFRSRAVARFVDEDLRPLAHEVVDRFADRGRADLATELAQVLPFWAISRKLGLPQGSEERQRALARRLLSYPVFPDHALAASAEVAEFLAPIVEERRRRPRDDVLSQLLHSEHDGQRLTDDDVVAHVLLLYAVGATTTSDGMSNALHALLSRPALVDRARDDVGLQERVVAETLRTDGPVALLPRLAVGGGPLGDGEIPPGTLVLAGIAAANRDPAVFEDPDRFDPDRDPGDTLTFGFGEKYCPGSHFGRQQIATAVEVVLERLPGVRLVDGAEPQGAILRSSPKLEVTWG